MFYYLGNKPHSRHLVTQATGASSGLPQGVINLLSFAAFMLNRMREQQQQNYAEVNTCWQKRWTPPKEMNMTFSI